MRWRKLIIDFNGLITEVVNHPSLSKTKVADALSHDKKTIIGWLRGSSPSDPSHVAFLIRLALLNGIDVGRFQSFEALCDLSLSSYEERIAKQPPELVWLTNAQRPPEAKIDFCGIKLDNPLGVASSPLLADDRWASLMLDLGYGLSTFKTKRTGAKQSWLGPHVAFVVEQPDVAGYNRPDPSEVLVTFDRNEVPDSIPNIVNSLGVPSEGPGAWQDMYERIKHHSRGGFVGISVMGEGATHSETERDFDLAIHKAKDVNPPFIELNFSCPNLNKDVGILVQPSVVRKICSRARRVLSNTGIRLIAKLPELPDSLLRAVLKEAGKNLDAVAFRNTISVRPVTKDRDGNFQAAFAGRQFAGLSGPCTFERTRRGVQQLVQVRETLGQDFRIVAIGGVSTPGHVVQLMDAGADVVQACTAAMFDPLLAWKVRFHLKQIEHKISPEVTLPFLQPRNQAEIESFNNALEAYGAIHSRQPRHAVSLHEVREKWNEWREMQPVAPVGKAHRISRPRTFEQWMRDFTK